ncbi:MAG: EscU/YscU/HrcU family type III secretion system export apparatus switch protein [Proteobacteria bacterium]|nr:EscU/YscU/HrcU family type III secretion system export apparatus switch protein [Pseudomonadota bacterium]
MGRARERAGAAGGWARPAGRGAGPGRLPGRDRRPCGRASARRTTGRHAGGPDVMSQEPRKTLAVALTYDAPRAPRVVASGRGVIGQKIIETAQAHGVPIQQNAVLAEALSTIELETEIPERLYVAVAEILAFVLRTAEEGQAR